MSSDSTVNEVSELLGSLREHARFLSELGAQHVEVAEDPVGESSAAVSVVTRAPNYEITVNANPKAISPPDEISMTTRAATIKSAPQDTLFGDLKPLEPSLIQSSETLEDVWRDIGDCTRCGLCEGRTQVVNTHGNPKARLMFVGEAPGADEDIQGKPFVGRAGQLLTKIIEAIGMKREEVLIGNVNRCRPPGNRQPTLEEAAICRPFLFREIAAVQPDVIVVLGNTALRNLLETREGISRVRGKFQNFRGIKVMPTFHPAYLLRDPSKKKETWEDLKKVRDYLDASRPIKNSV
jgi:uracil-DNA glycosylase family 4